MVDSDTIAAVATPPGVAAIAVVRISGPKAHALVARCFVLRASASATARAGLLRRGWLVDAHSKEKVDDALAVWFFAPRSYTGEDSVELHLHGGAGVVASALQGLLAAGARLAQPGEFTKRAFLNGRLDLAQAEAVADVISAETAHAARAAIQRLQDGGGALQALRAELLERLVEIEAHVDYPDEVSPPDEAHLRECITDHLRRTEQILQEANSARLLRAGVDCVIAGPPNAGKSTLLNALVQAERAIVSSVPGTTRDIIEDRASINGVVLRLRDTAGLREAADAIEAEGVRRARDAIESAELVLTIIDASRSLSEDDCAALELTAPLPRVLIANKLDLGDAGLAALRRVAGSRNGVEQAFVAGSMIDPNTIARIRAAISNLGWGGAVPGANRALVATSRQIQALQRARDALEHAARTLDGRLPIDLLSPDLRAAAAAYGEVTGDTVTAEVIDGIFSRFCVGK